jgi:cytochrome c-type biogenesis protein CcmH
MKRWLLIWFLILSSLQVEAAIEVYQFDQPQHENLYNQMIDELRCLVCQNQNLSASNAALAKDLRKLTYDMVLQGQSQEQIVDYMVQRYGDFVLYRPPVKASTLLLWFGPFILLFIGIFLLITTIKKRKKVTSDPLSNVQHKYIRDLLNSGD